MNRQIKLYGERNTGTNYLSKIIELNLNTNQIPGIAPPSVLKLQRILPGNELVRDIFFQFSYKKNLGWKHTSVKPYKNTSNKLNIAILTLTKNPYSWLLSLHRNPYHQYYAQKPSFKDFLQQPWKTVRRDNLNPILKNPIELWNLKNKSYLQLDKEIVLNITSEALINDPETIINEISQHFTINRKSNTFINYQQSTKDHKKNSNYYRDYYLNEKWREIISPEEIAIINKTLDRELMSHYGYTLLSPSFE